MEIDDKNTNSKNDIILEAKKVLLNAKLDRRSYEELQTNTASTPPESFQEIEENDQTTTNRILQKYFHKWLYRIKSKPIPPEVEHQVKLDEFIENLKISQNKRSQQHEPSKIITQKSQVFTNRFKAQKTIISKQRSKIEEQEKIINELTLGIIREDLMKSIESTKIDIREIFGNCSERLIIKAPLIKTTNEREQIMINSQQAPKSVQKMQEKALERAQYREIILERKRIIEETRQRLLEEAIEKKRILEEEERKQHLEAIAEQRKKELQRQQIYLEKKQKFEKQIAFAKDFYHKTLLKKSFVKLRIYYLKGQENLTLAISSYENKWKVRVLKCWQIYLEEQYKHRYEIADRHFYQKALKDTFERWKEFNLDAKRSMQVAEDFYDFKLTNQTFVHWHRFTCKQIMLEYKNIQIAVKHHKRKILFQYFYFWKSLPVVNQLEKAKEEKKRRWREKVWEILPDYQPPERL